MTERAFPLRLAVGLGHLERERTLLPTLCDGGNVALVARCLAADELVEQVRPSAVDVALVAADLHRLTDETLVTLRASRVPLVLLTDRPGDGPERGCTVLPLTATAEAVRAALLAAAGTPPPRSAPPVESTVAPSETAATEVEGATEASIIAVWSGPGERWRSRLAVEMAGGLGAVEDTILVDGDLAGPSAHALLDADPTRNLVTLLHADPSTPREWERAIAAEVQPLHPRSRHGAVLCGLPKPELRGAVTVSSFQRLVEALTAHCRNVVLDVGAEVLGEAGAVHRTALRMATRVLLVAAPDLTGLWQAKAAMRLWRDHLHLDDDRLAFVLAGHDPRHHHSRSEIEFALGLPVAAVIPHDHRALQRALAEQRPLVLDDKSRAARALLDLAGRVHGGEIDLPPETSAAPPRRLGFAVPQLRLPLIARAHGRKGAVDGEPVVATH